MTCEEEDGEYSDAQHSSEVKKKILNFVVSFYSENIYLQVDEEDNLVNRSVNLSLDEEDGISAPQRKRKKRNNEELKRSFPFRKAKPQYNLKE